MRLPWNLSANNGQKILNILLLILSITLWDQRPNILQDPALIAAWAGQQEIAERALKWGYEQFSRGAPQFQGDAGGLEGWHKDMKERIAHPERLRAIVEEQIVLH